jgi:hypothetical protein
MNPFRYGSTVCDEDFCRRPELERTLKGHIGSRQNVHIEGDRRTGKTSLVFEVCKRLRKSVILHYDFLLVKSVVDVRSRIIDGLSTASSRAGVFEKLLKALAHLKPTVSLNPTTGEPTLSVRIEDASDLQERSIPDLLAFGRNIFASQNLVVFCDEFQDVTKLPNAGGILAGMRTCIQRHHDCTYIYSGSSRSDMDAIFRNPDSPFYKSAIAVPVGAIPRADFVPFLASSFRSGRRSASVAVLEKILDLVSDNPGDAQEVCNCLWDVTDAGQTLVEADIDRALEVIFSRETRYFEQVLEDVTPLQKRCLVGLALFDGRGIYSKAFMVKTGILNTGSITRAVKQLENRRVISAIGKQFVFASPFLKLWLQRHPNL